MTDITIRGAGIFGLSIAWACVQRGATVQIIDPNGAGAGSSGGLVGALAPHVPESWNTKKAFQLESLLMTEQFWSEIAATGGKDAGYARTGRLQSIANETARAQALRRIETARELWQDNANWEVIPTSNTDWQPISPDGHLIRDTLSAHIHPRRACDALVAALEAKGVNVQPQAPDRGAVLWATGAAGLEELNLGRSRIVGSGEKGQAALLQYDASGLPQLFSEGVHVIPHLDGTVAVGSTTERYFENATSTDAQLDDVITAARRVIPILQDAPVIARWAGVRPRSRTRSPMLGMWPDRTGHFIANGGFKIGFGMAPKIAQVMADLILDGTDTIPDGFRVEDNL
ncbi:NAD(P)/FAD-dependent oxidoreductase [Sulfitobacter sp.]|uniref:NAD(P)/FAD-dependent oxidoreductase n=1 Tax=Sulfitobacter sp. TaxID=1903071 RepID=UPI0030035428